MTVSRERHKSGVAAIRMQLLDSDEVCGRGGGGGSRVKKVDFTVRPSLSQEEFREAVGWVLGLIGATYAVVAAVLAFLRKHDRRRAGTGYRALGRGPRPRRRGVETTFVVLLR